jgi:creatinine amidohydrolase
MWNSARRVLGLGLAVFTLQAVAQDSGKTIANGSAPGKQAGILLEKLSWDEAEKVLTPDQVVVIALGAESKEHGLHLPLNNDWLMAEYFKERVLEKATVVVAPTINYSFYPAFLEYPGSTSVNSDVARDMVIDIARSLSHYGPRKFYFINTGISTLRPLKEAADQLAKDGILMRYLDFTQDDPVETKWRKSGGTHADEIETAMMLYIAPDTVHIEKAKRDLNPHQPGGLTRDPKGKGTYSPTGAWGDPTMATREEGQVLVESSVARILKEIEVLRETTAPPATAAHP